MTEFNPEFLEFDKKVKESFLKQSVMKTLGINLISVKPGFVILKLIKTNFVLQQQGFIHGGVIAAGLDSACGFSALSLCAQNFEVLTIEFKTSFFAPGISNEIDFEGKVVKSGNKVCFCESDAFSEIKGEKKLIAKMSASIAKVRVPSNWESPNS